MKLSLLVLSIALVLLITVPLASADKLEITKPVNDKSFMTDKDGELVFEVWVENIDDAETITDVYLDLDDGEMSFSVSEMKTEGGTEIEDLEPGDTGIFEVEASGLTKEDVESEVEIRAEGTDDSDKTTRSDIIDITIKYPKPELEMIAPGTEITFSELTAEGTITLSAIAENTGEADLEGVFAEVEIVWGTAVCTVPAGTLDIASSKRGTFDIICENVSSGDVIKIAVEDDSGMARDFRQTTVYVPPVILMPKLMILEPMDGEDLLVEAGDAIEVVVSNDGNATAEEVCVSISGAPASEDDCRDIGMGNSSAFMLTFPTVPETVAECTVLAEDMDQLSSDEISIRIGTVKAWAAERVWFGNDTPPWLIEENVTENVTEPVEEEEPPPMTIDPRLQIIVVIIVVVVVVIYFISGMRRWSGKKTVKERVEERRLREMRARKERRIRTSTKEAEAPGRIRELTKAKGEPRFEIFEESKKETEI